MTSDSKLKTEASRPRGGSPGSQTLLYIGMFLAAALSPLGSTMIAVALPSISGELAIPSGTLTQWLVSSYLIVGIACMSPGGKLGDVIGHQRSLVIGMAIYGVGSAAGFVFANLPSLALARISMAAGGAMTVPATMALLRNRVPSEKRPRTFGYFGSVMGTAAAIGPLIGGELTARFGWRAIFIANVPVILAALMMIWIAGRNTPVVNTRNEKATGRPRFDVEGSVFLGAALTLLVLATQVTGAIALWIGITGAALLALFIVWERRTAEPVLDLRLYLRRNFAAGNAVIGLQNLAMYALLFQLPIFFEQVRGVERGVTGRTIIGMMIAMVVLAPFGGRLSERFGARPTVFTGSLVAIAGIYMIGSFQSLNTPADVLPGLVLLGAGLGLSSAPSQAAAMTAVSPSEAGMAGGAISSARYIGGVIGISALGYFLKSNSSVTAHTTATVVYTGALVIAALSALVLPSRN